MIVNCERLDDKGRGIVYVSSKVTFVPNLLPMEEADIVITKSLSKYNEGKVLRLLKRSCFRVNPNCPYLNCGCHLKHLDYNEQLKYKMDKVKNILFKFGRGSFNVCDIVSADICGYRNKVTLKVFDGVGYYENGSNNFIRISSCMIASARINKVIKKLSSLNLNGVSDIVIKDFDDVMVIIKGKMDVSLLKDVCDIIFMDGRLVYGKEYTKTNINGFDFMVSKDAFFQVNRFLTEKLYSKVLEYAGRGDVAFDLYCGTGTITLMLSQNFNKVIGIELNREAITCALENKKINKVSNAKFICGDVSLEIQKMKDGADVIVVDPPRSGLTKEGIDSILRISPSRVVYVSCDPITLARDLNVLKEFYDVTEITPFDMFPQTYHVECVSVLHRKSLEK